MSDLIGQRFGKLVVIAKAESYRSPKGSVASCWLCQCDCGSEPFVVRRDSLTTGNTRSCGCLHHDLAIHHGTGTRLYQTYRNMMNRCYRKDTDSYPLYGGVGIGVCDEWRGDFAAFREWAMANGYTDELTIERKDNSKDYSPDNCEWATTKQQSNHTSRNVYITYQGRTQTASQWAEELGMDGSTLRARLKIWNGDVERCLTTPVRKISK